MSPRYEVPCAAPTTVVWDLLSRPGRWSEWAPHVRGAVGLGSPQVKEGAHGLVLMLGAIPLRARITEVREFESWTWRVGLSGLVQMQHSISPHDQGCTLVIEIDAPQPLEAALCASYGRLIPRLLERLAHRAESVEMPTEFVSRRSTGPG